jgi:hypothetical protein
MTHEAVRWYKAAGAQHYHNAPCIFDCEKYAMPKILNNGYRNVEYHMGWDYCAVQLQRLGYVGDAYEICQLHKGHQG